MAIRKPIVIVTGNHLSELPTGDSLMAHLDPDTTTLPELIEALIASGIMGEPVVTIPVNTSSPVVSGAVVPGDDATTTNGTWTQSPTAYEYKWQEFLDPTWTDVSGETANTYEDMPLGEFRSAVRAENSAGWSDWAYSLPFVVAAAPTGTTWADVWQAVLSGGDAIATRGVEGTGYGHAWSAGLAGNVYVEFEVDMTTGPVDIGIWVIDDPVTPQSWWNGGDFSYQGGSSLKALLAEYWSLNYYGDAGYLGGPEPNHTDDPLYRGGFALNTTTGAVWLRDVWSTGASAWFGGGDPAAGTSPTFTLSTSTGFETFRLAASFDDAPEAARIVTPADHYGTAPSGFTPA